MSTGALVAKDDWAGRPATKGALMLVKTDLELMKADVKSVKADLTHRIDRVAADLEGRIERVRGDLPVAIEKQGHTLGTEIAKLKVSMAWMSVGVVTGLGGPGNQIRTAIVPRHREVRVGTLNSILRQAGLTVEQFNQL